MPLTTAGNIVVDGFVASCYASVDHDLAHTSTFLMRWLPSIVEWILGKDKEIPAYVKIAAAIGEWVLPFPQY